MAGRAAVVRPLALFVVWSVSFLVVHRVSTTYNIVLRYMTLLRRLEENRDQ
jgi:hypothetical protein